MSGRPRHRSRTMSTPRPKSSKEEERETRRRHSPRPTEDLGVGLSRGHSIEDDNVVRKEDRPTHRVSKRRRESKDVEESRPRPRARQSPSPQRLKPGRRPRPRSRESCEKYQKEIHYSEEYNDRQVDDSSYNKSKRRHLSDEEVDEPRQSSHSPISRRRSPISRRHSSDEGAHKSNQTSPDYRRYWGRGDSDSDSTSRRTRPRPTNSDRYWSKYPANDKAEPVGSRYYGEYSSKSRPLDDKENHKKKRLDNDDKNTESVHHRNANEQKTTRENEARPRPTTPSKESLVQNDIAPPPAPRQKKNLDMLTTKTGGAYIPPARLRMMQAQITDKSSAAYQRLSWEALKKSIHGHINKVNTANIAIIVRELLKENVVRGRGLLCRSIIQAQAASPTFTHVYAALVSVINSKFPNISELLLRRLIIQFKRGFKRNDKSICISAASFIAHLVNQRVAHEILALEILTLLVESPTDDSVEVAIAFLKECGMKLMEVSNKGLHAIFEMLRNILHEGHLDKRVQYMIEVMFQVRKDNFRDHEAILEQLDLVDEEDQFTHLLTLEDVKDPEDILNVFKFDPEYEENEAKYKVLKHEILDDDSNESGSDSGSEGGSEEESDENEEDIKEGTIIDNTETNLIALRRTIYLTIHSSLDFEECAHKLMRMELKPGQEIELCHMFLDCCAEQRTYEKFYGLLSQRFCQINKIFIPPFQQIFRNTYDTIHRLDTNKLRNVAKFFAHLLFTDAISWEVLSLIHLNEEETTSSSRIFIKILFQELSEYMGLTKLNERVKDGTLQAAFEGLFPRDDPKNTRFAINFFTSIGLGGLTDELREHLKSQPKVSIVPKIAETLQVSSDSSSSGSSSSSSSDSSSDSSSSSSSESEESNGGLHRSKKSRKAEKKKQTRKMKIDSKSLKKKKPIVVSPPKHKKKKASSKR